MSGNNANAHYVPVREDWLARRIEPALEPDLPIIDPHHHLWDRPGWRYQLDELLADTRQGHNIVSTVFVQCRAMHRAAGPEAYKPVGETEYVTGIAAMSASGEYGPTRVAEGIVGHVNLQIGEEARDVLQAHIAAAGGRFRGIRHITAWDPDPVIMNPAYQPPQDILFRKDFRAGFRQLAPLGLSFDAWLYHPQIPDLTALARAFPETPIVLDHVGGPLGIRGYAGQRDEVFRSWRAAMAELATCPNVHMKLGGLGMRINGMGFEDKADPPSSDELAAAWKPWMHTTIELFGATRCMFESNFPVDKGSYSYGVFWNACKKLAAGASAAEKAALFAGTARSFYKLS
ncbi:amidohydrolase family protein [Siccirubricoccus sp. KC 17139]|uniref:Amidohydrolase family protein n=1 Tax=Siccirubricoccus soli TaxID=2899147 RepID=A0ABT1D4U1_9PROT|nr:amidohydrolase family protein [Siccirubricoccus soli]MCO6416934.1 amidohydrolase family protein [Siccirubricoccus soli]MCP2683069.1 amidohydrolase family protein [Siccirubricoccus soli]